MISMVSYQKGPTRHAYAWQIGPYGRIPSIYNDSFRYVILTAVLQNKNQSNDLTLKKHVSIS